MLDVDAVEDLATVGTGVGHAVGGLLELLELLAEGLAGGGLIGDLGSRRWAGGG